MARVIAVASGKGGVGKSTLSTNLGAALGEMGRKVLLVDVDAQGATTAHLGIKIAPGEATLTEVLRGEASVTDAGVIREVHGVHVIPASAALADVELALAGEMEREVFLTDALDPVLSRYDVVILDCRPEVGLLVINGLVAASEVLIPFTPDFLSLRGVAGFLDSVARVRKRLNKRLRVLGVVPNLYNPRRALTHEVLDAVSHDLKLRVFKCAIRQDVKIAEAPAKGLPVTVYAPHSHGAADFRALAIELEGD